MTNGTKLRQAKRMLRELCKINGKHYWKGDKHITCEVCGVKK